MLRSPTQWTHQAFHTGKKKTQQKAQSRSRSSLRFVSGPLGGGPRTPVWEPPRLLSTAIYLDNRILCILWQLCLKAFSFLQRGEKVSEISPTDCGLPTVFVGLPWGRHHLGVPTPPQLSHRLHPEPVPADQWDAQHLDPLFAHLVRLTRGSYLLQSITTFDFVWFMNVHIENQGWFFLFKGRWPDLIRRWEFTNQ